jgi:Astacin (Peptidase family M12A)
MRFRKRTNEENYVFVTSREPGCTSYIGRIGGPQIMRLGPGCVNFVTIIHEFYHAAGFFHMQSASDRDNFVRVLWDNINPEEAHNFEKYPSTMISQFGVPYDFTSVMHYGAYDFSINGLPTLEALTGNEIRPSNTWSWWDIERLNNVYCR